MSFLAHELHLQVEEEIDLEQRRVRHMEADPWQRWPEMFTDPLAHSTLFFCMLQV